MHIRSYGFPAFLSSLPASARCALALGFCIGFADGVMLPFLALWAEHVAHVSSRFVGPLLACYSAGELIATPWLGGAADRWGRRPVLLASLLGVGGGFMLLPFCQGAIEIAAVLLAIGVAECALHPTVSTVIADVVAPARHRQAFAWARGVSGLGRIAGPATGAMLAAPALGGVFFGAAGALLAGALMVLAWMPETRHPGSHHNEEEDEDNEPGLAGLLPAFRDRQLASMLGWLLCVEICAGWVPAVLPLFAHDTGLLTPAQVGWLFTYGAALLAGLQVATAGRLARVDGGALVWSSALALAAAFAAILLLGGVAGLAVGMTLLSLNQMLLGPLVPATLGALAPPHRRAVYMAAGSVVNDLEDTLGPAIGTLVYGVSPRLPWIVGIPLALGAGFALSKRMRRMQRAGRREAESDSRAPEL
ncbi:MFS transporter [Burkholderia sp. 22PA0106]|uniref:MFS transporter n=1 Tax=Burkholderia sp. 22PA0106 TaxID=3237371 RepID=UPI0039C132E5